MASPDLNKKQILNNLAEPVEILILDSTTSTNDVAKEKIHEIMSEKIKEINNIMPAYKSIRGVVLSETPLIKTTTNKIKRQEEIKTIE